MFSSLIQQLNCEICGCELSYNPKATFDMYSEELDLVIDLVESKVNNIIGRVLVYECPICKKFYRYTYKDIEATVRMDMTKKVLLNIAMGQMKNMEYIRDGVLVYCGKCTGFDGNGSCTRKMYNNCKVKEFPRVI